MAHSQIEASVEDGWPWNCARCGTTIYHDAVHCKSCEHRSRGEGESASHPLSAVHSLGELFEWIGDQSYLSLVAKFSTIAGVEVSLTALWLWILYLGPVALPSGVPV